MADFLDALNVKAEDVQKPKPRPAGTYLAAIQGLPDQQERKDNKILEFKCKLMIPESDVDTDQLSDQPEISSWPPMKYSVFVNEPWPLKRFLTEVLGIDADGRTLREMLAEVPGKQLKVNVQHRPYMTADGQPDIAADIKAVAKA